MVAPVVIAGAAIAVVAAIVIIALFLRIKLKKNKGPTKDEIVKHFMDNHEENRKLLRRRRRRNKKTGQLEDIPDGEDENSELPDEPEPPVEPPPPPVVPPPPPPEKQPRGFWYKGKFRPDPNESDEEVGDLFEGYDLVAWVTDGRHDNVHRVKEICFGQKKLGEVEPTQPYRRLNESTSGSSDSGGTQPPPTAMQPSRQAHPAVVRYESLFDDEDFVGWVLDGRKDNFGQVHQAVFGQKQVGVRQVRNLRDQP